ncbi:MAG: O-antigen ligase family protein [Methylotenera sp.]|nr:O-antigen ligase family protein [Methylotenera sp.]
MLLIISRNHNRIALFFLLLFAVPPFAGQISGLGLINYFAEMDSIRLLVLAILAPAFFTLRQLPYYKSFGKLLPDKILLGYLCLIITLYFKDTSVTDALRQTLYLLIDLFLPYMVISRYVNTLQKFKEALLAFVIAALIMAIISMFELVRHWLLYASLDPALGVSWGLSGYQGRSDLLRASASAGHPIVLGYIMTVAIGFYLFFQNIMPKNLKTKAGGLALLGGLIAPLSRGPWVGAGILVVTYIITGRNALKKLVLISLLSLISLPIIGVMPGGNKIINLLPFVGQTEKENIEYRENLLDVSILVIKKNLAFGSVDFLQAPEMQVMIQGQGIIDIVNTYISIALSYGLVGLALFVSFFFVILKNIHSGMKFEANKDSEYYLLGRTLLCTLIGILVIIFTVSSISFVPIVYWSVSGLGVAYYQMMRNLKEAK